MKLVSLVLFISLLNMGTAAVLYPCPKFCKCDYAENTLRAKCSSQKFLHKLEDKQAYAIHSLDLSNVSMKNVDKQLKKLQNLHHLDLSNNELNNINYFPNLPKLEKLSLAKNELKSFSFSTLPKGIEDLNLSSNYLQDLPKDWYLLHNLRTINLHNNPVNCDDTSINKYVNLQEKVNITENVICQSPKKMNGKTLQSLIVDALLNKMQADQAETTENDEEVDNSEFLKYSTPKPEDSEQSLGENFFEGSGDEEGSGDSEKIDPLPCFIDCSTFKPLPKENDTSPLLSIKEQVGILVEDLFGKEQEHSSLPAVSTATENPSTTVKEGALQKTVTLPISELPKTTKKTEKLVVDAADNKETENLERASLEENDDNYTYYLIAVVIVLMILVAIFIIIKKRSSRGKPNRKRNSINENGICEEMKPLGKYREITNGTNNEKVKEDDVRPERIPLMNGQNGKGDLPTSQKGSLEELDVTLREPSENDSSSPKPEKVTIIASEIPPSVLKTPQLVHRELNSEGEIVTKPLDDSY